MAPNRRRALVAVALGVAALSMVLLAAAMGLIRAWYLSNATGEVLPTDAALDIARTVLAVRLAMRAVLVLGLVVALAAFLVGPPRPPAGCGRWAARCGPPRGPASRSALPRPSRPGSATTRVPSASGSWPGVLVLAFWTYPSGATVLSIVLAVVAVLAVVELVGVVVVRGVAAVVPAAAGRRRVDGRAGQTPWT